MKAVLFFEPNQPGAKVTIFAPSPSSFKVKVC